MEKEVAQAQLISIEQLEENTGQITGLPENPRFIDEERLALLQEDIKKYPEFLMYNPLKVFPFDGRYVIIGGNMRFRALSTLGYKKIPCVILSSDTPIAKLRAYVIIDNSGFGQWDWKKLKKDDWGEANLTSWGVELPDDWNTDAEDESDNQKGDESYSRKVVAPTYEPSGQIPTFREMYDTTKRDALISEIEKADIPDEVREFLREAARRHTVFNYEKIADYYAQASAKIQDLMERSALVIIDFDKAIEGGYITMTKDLANAYRIERNITDEDELTESDISDDYDEE